MINCSIWILYYTAGGLSASFSLLQPITSKLLAAADEIKIDNKFEIFAIVSDLEIRFEFNNGLILKFRTGCWTNVLLAKPVLHLIVWTSSKALRWTSRSQQVALTNLEIKSNANQCLIVKPLNLAPLTSPTILWEINNLFSKQQIFCYHLVPYNFPAKIDRIYKSIVLKLFKK